MKEKQIQIQGFTTNTSTDKVLVIGMFGIQGSGKSRFGITAPDPIGVIPTNRKTRQTVDEMKRELGKVVVMPEHDFIRHARPLDLMQMDDAKVKRHYADHVDQMVEAAYKLAQHPDIKTIIVDDFSQFCEDCLFKHYGRTWRIMPRDRGPFNQDIIDFINSISSKHVVLTHKAAEIWENKINAKGDEEGKPTGKYRQKGFGDLGYHCNVVLEMKKNKEYDISGNGNRRPWKYSLDVVDCQKRPELEGPQGKDLLTDDLIDFTHLAMEIYPDADPAEFM